MSELSDDFMGIAEMFPRPVGVSGCSRSGTTILRRAIGKHPDIVGRELESPIISPLLNSIKGMTESGSAKYFKENTELSSQQLFDKMGKLIFECVFGDNYGRERFEGMADL